MSPSRNASQISDSLGLITRTMHSGKTHQAIEERAGTRLDKLSEVILRQAMHHGDSALRLSDIAERLGVELSSVSRKVAKLETSGFIERQSDPIDGRVSRLQVTVVGKQAVTDLLAARTELAESALESWSAQDREQFQTLLDRFATDLHLQLGEACD